MDRDFIRAATALLSGVLIAFAGALPAAASTSRDTTPPTLALPRQAAFLQGGILDTGTDPYSTMPMYVTWQGHDASGICGYDVGADTSMGPLTFIVGTQATRYSDPSASDYDGNSGGGASQLALGWIVTAHDCAGNSTSREAGLIPIVTQEDGFSPTSDAVSIAYRGTWGTSSCTCWSAGAVRRSVQAGATATIRFASPPGATVGLVMEKAPNRGRFTLLVDGVSRATIETYARVATHRVIVWAGRLATAGNHVIQLVNLATPGRARIDLDAVLLNKDNVAAA
jgi:hypothetical protein